MVWSQGMNCKWTRSFRKLACGKLSEWTPVPRMGRKSVLRSGLTARRVERSDGTGRQGWDSKRNAATQVRTEAKGEAATGARGLATGTDRGGRGEGRLLSVEGAKMRVGRGGEFGRRLPSSKIENNGQPVDSMLINLTILK